MSRKHAKLDANGIPWKEFVSAYQVAMGALMSDGTQSPSVSLTGSDDDAEASEVEVDSVSIAETASDLPADVRERLKKDPYARVVVALRAHFGPGYPYYRPFIYRFWSLYDLVHRGQLPEWVESKEDGTMGLHPALLLAASDVKLTKKGKLPTNHFRERVRTIISEEMGKMHERPLVDEDTPSTVST